MRILTVRGGTPAIVNERDGRDDVSVLSRDEDGPTSMKNSMMMCDGCGGTMKEMKTM
jgi:hypothetical protein